MGFDLNYFKSNFQKFEGFYNKPALFEKIRKIARKAGVKVVYGVLILYYASLDKDIPVKDRVMIIAALGYFICPLDFIPDALPGGFADDMSALIYVIKQIYGNLTPEVFRKARARLEEWFGPVEDDDLRLF